ncbi:hypothetical protein SGLAM104S_06575 [Streptomyces glaucescens]
MGLDELTQSARLVAERGRAEGEAWLARLWRRTTITVWALVLLLLLVQALTAIGAGGRRPAPPVCSPRWWWP